MSNTTNPPPIPEEFMKAQGAAAAEYKVDWDRGHLADCDFSEGAQWAFRHLSPTGESAGRWEWIELKTGCEMPEIDEFVLWKREDGNCFVREIDKDDNTWWKGDAEADELFGTGSKCTHWARIKGPASPQPLNEIEREWKRKAEKWDELDEQISKFYCNSKGEADEDDPENPGDLTDIGEIAARAFNWL